MQGLTPAGQQIIDDIARRHGFSTDAVLSMLQSVIQGNGRMAQFNHPEFSGAGQWMNGGMTMVSDIFNNNLKASVGNLCAELAQLVAAQPGLFAGARQQGTGTGAAAGASLFVPPAPGQAAEWWGAGLGWPDSAGAQNGVRYAYFAQARRLAIEVHGRVTLYDTLDHRIGGFSQQQSGGGSLGFSSQHGLIDVARLPVVSVDGVASAPAAAPAAVHAAVPAAGQAAPPMPAAPAPATPAAAAASVPSAASAPIPPGTPSAAPDNPSGMDIVATIERLAELHGRNILTDAEFQAKKAELLARL